MDPSRVICLFSCAVQNCGLGHVARRLRKERTAMVEGQRSDHFLPGYVVCRLILNDTVPHSFIPALLGSRSGTSLQHLHIIQRYGSRRRTNAEASHTGNRVAKKHTLLWAQICYFGRGARVCFCAECHDCGAPQSNSCIKERKPCHRAQNLRPKSRLKRPPRPRSPEHHFPSSCVSFHGCGL